MGRALVLDEKEKQTLLSQIDSRETYNDLLIFLDTVKHKNNCPYTDEEYKALAVQSIKDADKGLGTGLEEMRRIHPR